jgi:hypothetical protein
MTLDHTQPSLSPLQYAALFDAARRRAHELRDEALSDAARSVGRALTGAFRSAREALLRFSRTRSIARRRAMPTRCTG